MWGPALYFFLSFLPPLTLGSDCEASNFALEYFINRDVKFICLVTCEEDLWINKFAKKATKKSIGVTVVKNDVSDSTILRHYLQKSYYSSVGVVIDSKCSNFEETMYYASMNTLFDAAHKWLILDNNSYIINENDTLVDDEGNISAEVVDVVGKLNISVDSDIVIASNKDDTGFELYELYNFGKIQGGDVVSTSAGKWSFETGFSYNFNEYKYYRRWNFQGWSMRMISVVSPTPENFDTQLLTDRNPTEGVATITKVGITVLEVIADLHNIRFVHSMADRWISDFTYNKSKEVVASSLYYRQQDISPVIRMIRGLEDKTDLVHPPVTSIETRYYYRIPTYGAGKFENQFLRPLSTGAWLSVILVTALCALVLLLSAKLERRPSSGQYALFSVIASVCQQFFDENTLGIRRESGARKLTILVTGISCVLLYNYYTSSVVSWLLNGPPPSINSLQELLNSPLDLIFEDIGYTRSWLQTPSFYFNKRNAEIEDELRKKKVLNKKKDAPLMMSVDEGIWMVRAGGFAYHTEVDNANRLISRTFTQEELCELGSLQSMEKTLLYPTLQKNSPYKEFFVWSMIRLLERGIVRCIQQRMYFPDVKCEGSSPRALALGGAAPAFLLLAGGYFLATIVMLAERAIWNHKRNPKVFMQRKKSRKLTNRHYI